MLGERFRWESWTSLPRADIKQWTDDSEACAYLQNHHRHIDTHFTGPEKKSDWKSLRAGLLSVLAIKGFEGAHVKHHSEETKEAMRLEEINHHNNKGVFTCLQVNRHLLTKLLGLLVWNMIHLPGLLLYVLCKLTLSTAPKTTDLGFTSIPECCFGKFPSTWTGTES